MQTGLLLFKVFYYVCSSCIISSLGLLVWQMLYVPWFKAHCVFPSTMQKTRLYFSLFVIVQTMVQVRHMAKLLLTTWGGTLLCVSNFLLQQRVSYCLRCCLEILAPDSISRHLSQFWLFLQLSLSYKPQHCWVRHRYCLAGITKLGEQVAKNTKLE